MSNKGPLSPEEKQYLAELRMFQKRDQGILESGIFSRHGRNCYDPSVGASYRLAKLQELEARENIIEKSAKTPAKNPRKMAPT